MTEGVIDWDEPNDGETTEEMLEVLRLRRLEEERTRAREQRQWEYAGYFDANGDLYTRPRE